MSDTVTLQKYEDSVLDTFYSEALESAFYTTFDVTKDDWEAYKQARNVVDRLERKFSDIAREKGE